MKYHTTTKKIKTAYNCISVGYCELQHLLHLCAPVAYNSGVYGWNYDVYTFANIGSNIAICTGYRGMPGKDLNTSGIDYRAFELKARDIITTYQFKNFEKEKEELFKLLKDFLTKVEEELFN